MKTLPVVSVGGRHIWRIIVASSPGRRKLQLQTSWFMRSVMDNRSSFILCGFDGVVVLAHELRGKGLLVDLEVIDEAVLAKMSNWTNVHACILST